MTGRDQSTVLIRRTARQREIGYSTVLVSVQGSDELIEGQRSIILDPNDPEVIRAADYVLTKAGGQGALRELCDLILKNSVLVQVLLELI